MIAPSDQDIENHPAYQFLIWFSTISEKSIKEFEYIPNSEIPNANVEIINRENDEVVPAIIKKGTLKAHKYLITGFRPYLSEIQLIRIELEIIPKKYEDPTSPILYSFSDTKPKATVAVFWYFEGTVQMSLSQDNSM